MKKIVAVVAFLLPSLAVAQGVRFTPSPITTTATVAGVANVYVAVTASTIAFCNAPANATPCTNKASTFTDATLGTPCGAATQVVLDGTSACVAAPDALGNWGIFAAPGQYAYTVTTSAGASFGPFYVTLSLTGTSPSMTTPKIAGETVSAAPRGAFSGTAVSLTSTGRVMQMPPDKAITVTSISYTVPPGGTVGTGCAQAPQVRVTDGSTLSATLTLANSSGGNSLTGLSVNYAAGADLRLEVAFNATGCSPNWANVNFVVQFKMQ